MNKLLLAAALCLAGAGLASAQPSAPAASLTPEQTVAARQSAYMLSAGTFGGMKGVIDSGADVNVLVFGSRALARWARQIPHMFPAGSDVPSSKARPEVWSDRAGFDQAAADYAAAADRLVALAQANDKAGFATQWEETRKTCSACHDRYRAQPAR